MEVENWKSMSIDEITRLTRVDEISRLTRGRVDVQIRLINVREPKIFKYDRKFDKIPCFPAFQGEIRVQINFLKFS